MLPALLTAIVLAQAPQRLQVQWVSPDSCPPRAELTSGLESSVPRDRTFSASVRVDEPHQPGQSWRAVVVTRSDLGEATRVVDAPDCSQVGQAAVLVVTLAATQLKGEVAPVRAPDDTEAPAPVTVEASAEDEPRGPPAPPFWSEFAVQLLVGGSVGVLPLPDASFGGALALSPGRWRLELALTSWLDGETSRKERGANFSALAAHLSGAWLFRPTARLQVGPSVGVEVGKLTAQAMGVTAPEKATAAWVTALAGATAGYQPIAPLRLWLSVELGLNALRPQFMIATPEGLLTAHRMGLLAGRLTLGVEFHTP